MAFIDFVNHSVQRLRARYHLTAEERHNLRLAHTPVAVISASLGSPAHQR
ncbi:MAG: hypothetical protein J2P18_19200 [Nocardia sp.]|nr:hypothetical protein [Nocardia sp.]